MLENKLNYNQLQISVLSQKIKKQNLPILILRPFS
jgi:hypothetical protein